MAYLRTSALSLCAAGALALPAAAEIEISAYTGMQTAPHSTVSGTDPGGLGAFSIGAGWEGKSLSMPPYYGFRATIWREGGLGFGVDFNHAKVYADDATLTNNGLQTLEFTDGVNFLTANVWKRWENPSSKWTPYVGAGIGLAIPHVEFQSLQGPKTEGYQVTGPAIQAVGGIKYSFNETWAIFGEYKGTWSKHDADLTGGGSLETTLITNALNIGISYSF